MSLTIIVGKPGSGKSYYAVSKILFVLEDCLRFENQEKEQCLRKLITNLPLDIEAISSYLSDRLGYDVDVKNYVELINEADILLKGKNKIPWWSEFSVGSYIVIDEVHKYLGEGLGKENKYYRDAHRDWVMEHRHKQQDIVYITQHQDNIDRSVLRGAEERIDIKNAKRFSIPLFGIPVRDIDIVRKAFGSYQQFAVASKGHYVGSIFHYDDNYERFLLDSKIFALYKSHSGDDASDSPDLKLSRIGALLWFGRRHFFKVLFVISSVYLFIRFVIWLITGVPFMVQEVLLESLQKQQIETKKIEKQEKPPVEVLENVPVPKPVPVVVESKKEPDDLILGFVGTGVITADGIKRVGTEIMFGGKKERIKSVNVKSAEVFFQSGKKYKK